MVSSNLLIYLILFLILIIIISIASASSQLKVTEEHPFLIDGE